MAPRRNNCVNEYSSHILPDLYGLTIEPLLMENHDPNVTTCCVPTCECLRNKEPIYLNNLLDVVRVVCTNECCTAGKYMHKECFEHWEAQVLSHLKSCGRARSWTDKQRQQNLWKNGYDLVFKMCNCLCGRGFLRKDQEWCPLNANVLLSETEKKKKKKRKPNNINNNNNNNNNTANNNRPALQISQSFNNGYVPTTTTPPRQLDNVLTPVELRARTVSISSSIGSNGSSSPPASSSNSMSPTIPLPGVIGSGQKKKKKVKKLDPFSALNGSGIFFRRKDFSAFNILPRHKLNSYHVKMEDEGNHGNDEIRSFVLSNLTAHHQSKVMCVLCSAPMKVYDRYPLIDGTFFLSPIRHAKGSVEVAKDNRRQFLSGICMRCLEAFAPGSRVRCIYCNKAFDGGSMVLGTMYTYDVFAAMPCCQDRVKCTGCQTPLLLPHERLNFYSDYSRLIICPQCGTKDYHFIRPISTCYALESPT